MNLVIDIGNSSVKAAVFDGEALIDTLNAPGSSLAFIDKLTEKYPIKSGILATVVNLDEENRNWLRQQAFAILELNHDTPLPITNLYKTPHTLGYDRIAAVVGAYANSPGKDILVVDAGTAITYEFLDSQGRYHGGNISPGVQMRFKALHQLTNRLPLVSAQGEVPSMGYDTDTAIRAGVLKGIEYEIRGYITSLKHKYPELLVFLTGREEFSFDTTVKNIIFADSFLVLKGLNRILKYNNGRF